VTRFLVPYILPSPSTSLNTGIERKVKEGEWHSFGLPFTKLTIVRTNSVYSCAHLNREHVTEANTSEELILMSLKGINRLCNHQAPLSGCVNAMSQGVPKAGCRWPHAPCASACLGRGINQEKLRKTAHFGVCVASMAVTWELVADMQNTDKNTTREMYHKCAWKVINKGFSESTTATIAY